MAGMSETPDDVPTAIWSGSFMLGGVEMRCHVLDNGQRVIESESVGALFEAMARPDFSFAGGEVDALARWQKDA
jgi:hypothetical protein